jgi:hypothetical protein
MKYDTLFIGGTHGDEPIGVDVLKRLEQEASGFDWIIGNPLALRAGTRCFEGDLNRSAPGDPRGATYALRRAARVIDSASAYRKVIDLHGTGAFTGIFIIITKPSRTNLELALRFDIRDIVLWPSFSWELMGTISENVPCGIEIECGPKDMPLVKTKLLEILKSFLESPDEPVRPESLAESISRRRLFEVYGSLPAESAAAGLEEFVSTEVNGETFVPLLIDRYRERNGILCYKMRPLTEPLMRFKS